MKKTAFIVLVLFCTAITSFAQKTLSKQIITDFAAVCWYNYRFGNTTFIATMNTFLSMSPSDVAVLMEHLDTDTKGREKVFQVFYRVSSGNYESLFRNLYGLNLTASESKELAFYILDRYGSKGERGEVVKTEFSGPFYLDKNGNKVFVSEDEVKYDPLFQGTRTFTDVDGSYLYKVTIKKNAVTIDIHTGINEKNIAQNQKLIKRQTGFVKCNRFVSSSGKDLGYKVIDGILYVLKKEGSWNECYELGE